MGVLYNSGANPVARARDRMNRAAIHGYLDATCPAPEWAGEMRGLRFYKEPFARLYYRTAFRKGREINAARREMGFEVL